MTTSQFKSTFWKYCTFKSDIPPWELKYFDDKGWCAFSLHTYEPGDIILIEKPTMIAEGHHPFNMTQLQLIEDNILLLSEEDRLAFYDMSNVFPEAPTIAAGIFMTNSFDMVGSTDGECCAMYCAIARLNHSCYPNVQQTHIPHTQEEILVATRRINIGDEINDCYIDLRHDRTTRRQLLLENYYFTCACHACTIDMIGGTSTSQQLQKEDKQRMRAITLESLIVEKAEEGDTDEALSLAFELVSLLTHKDTQGWSTRYISSAYLYIYHIALTLDMNDYALQMIQKAHIWNIKCQGPNTPDSIHTSSLLKEFGK